jgi:hypothetical protein
VLPIADAFRVPVDVVAPLIVNDPLFVSVFPELIVSLLQVAEVVLEIDTGPLISTSSFFRLAAPE